MIDMGTSPVPKYAFLSGKGKVRVLSYDDGYFRVLTNRDEIILVKRERLVFVK